ncbi:hypothetical protein FSP39_021853 [Pinctada imbricata]|uniref:Uncharacterized protein n=1 Tax=Pinctada imbricata TaxID=66713 RepID=A0AA88YMF8_PINIB|nr:hypothetical protein FSP39_021853 [Pinctada imbricata]
MNPHLHTVSVPIFEPSQHLDKVLDYRSHQPSQHLDKVLDFRPVQLEFHNIPNPDPVASTVAWLTDRSPRRKTHRL